MHVSLENFNLLLSRKATDEERATWTDHILACEQCGAHFRALNELHQKMAPRAKMRHPLRYAMGVAAVMTMCFLPYLTHKDEAAVLGEPVMVAQLQPQAEAPAEAQFSVLGRVAEVNYGEALASWGSSRDLTSLVKLSNKRN